MNGLVGPLAFAIVATVTALALGDGMPWLTMWAVAVTWAGVQVGARVTERWSRLRWRSRSLRFRFAVVLGIVWAAYGVVFTVVDDGDVGFGLFGGGLLAVPLVSTITIATLVFGRPDRGWYLRR